eukprot:1573175-Karenia_brevis.AAC.1
MNKVNSVEWVADIEKNVLQAGNTRTCAPHTETLQRCHQCNTLLSQAAFSSSWWQNRHEQKPICEECEMLRCSICGQNKTKNALAIRNVKTDGINHCN